MNRRRRTGSKKSFDFLFRIFHFLLESDRLQMENEYLYQQMSKSSPLNELVQIKKDLDKSERQRDQLSDHLEVRQTGFFFVIFQKSFRFCLGFDEKM